MRHLILITLLFLASSMLTAQEIQLTEKEEIMIESLQKGRFMLGIGAYLDAERRLNEEDFTAYILDEKNNNLNVRLSLGYFDQDRKAFGISFRYIRNNSQTKYLDLSRDTLNYSNKDNEFHIHAFRKILYPVFGSTRVYFITEPDLTYQMVRSERLSDQSGPLVQSSKRGHRITAGFNVGFLVFPFSGFSIEGRIGPLGLGYSWERFFEEGQFTSGQENFFIHMAPRIWMINFMISSYF